MTSKVQRMNQWIAGVSLFIEFTIAEDYQRQPRSQGVLSQYGVKEFKNIFLDLQAATKKMNQF